MNSVVPVIHEGVEATPFEFDTAMEKREKALFQNAPQKPNRTLLFIVPDRKQSTLLPIIERYVAPGTMIFSDQWRAYINLNGRCLHYTVAHNKRFVKYIFKPMRGVIKVTTNHIERVWVEVRRKLKGIQKEMVPLRIQEIPYRNMRLRNERHRDSVGNMFEDIKKIANSTRTPSAFEPSNEVFVIE